MKTKKAELHPVLKKLKDSIDHIAWEIRSAANDLDDLDFDKAQEKAADAIVDREATIFEPRQEPSDVAAFRAAVREGVAMLREWDQNRLGLGVLRVQAEKVANVIRGAA